MSRHLEFDPIQRSRHVLPVSSSVRAEITSHTFLRAEDTEVSNAGAR